MKIGFFITARLKSTRLKRKILLDLEGKPVLQRIIDRCQNVRGINGIVLCTSTNPQDSELYEYALRNQIEFYPGSGDDVLGRLLTAAEYYGYDAFLSITADNPLFSIETSQMLLDWYEEVQRDFLFTKGLPMGCSTSLLSVNALKVCNFIKNLSDTEIWGPFVNRPDFFCIGELQVVNSPYNEEKRLTLDYPEDYSLIQKIYSMSQKETPDLKSVFDILTTDESLWEINKSRKQMIVSNDRLKKIDNWFGNQKEAGKSYAKSLGIELTPGFEIKKVSL